MTAASGRTAASAALCLSMLMYLLFILL